MTHGAQLTLTDGSSTAVIAPERGGIATRFAASGAEILFMDDSTLRDPTKNVRGGVPVLFPTPGKLVDDRWARGGGSASGGLKQHGFARNLPWRVTDARGDRATLELTDDATTRADYPWPFAVELGFRVIDQRGGQTLRIDQRVTNRGTTAMPFGFGFHPYFQVADRDKPQARISTAATRAFDNVSKRTIELAGPIDLAKPEVDLHLLDHGSTSSTLTLPGRAVEVRGSAEYTHWVVWTLAGRDFVCLEPWTAPGNAMNTGERLIELAPGATRELWTEIVAR